MNAENAGQEEIEVTYSILGSLNVMAGNTPVAVSGPRQRTILSMLVLAWGRVVSVDSLVDAVWGDRPPATARTQIAICVGALRKAFKQAGAGGDVIATVHPGYSLKTARSETDAMRFSALVAQAAASTSRGEPNEASALYRKALDQWQSSAFAGVTGRRIEDEATRLDEMRLAAYEAWSEVELRLGRHQALISELAAVTQEYPFHEQLRHHLMLAQYRAGRRAEAAEGFRSWRRHFVGELGLEPSPAILELHSAILRDDPDLTLSVDVADAQAATRLVPAELPPEPAGFVGRGEERTLLDSLVTDRGPQVALVTGVAGVGKTGLVMHWAHQVAEEFPDGQLYADSFANDAEQGRVCTHAMAGRFLRALGLPAERIPADAGERISLYRSVLADRRALIILDNVCTMEQVRPLLPGSGRSRVVVIGRKHLAADHDVVQIRLGLMPGAQAQELVRQIARTSPLPRRDGGFPDRGDGAAMHELVRLCGGLPLALRIAAGRLASKPHWSVEHLVHRLSDEHRRLDELSLGGLEVRASFALTYRALSHEAARMYRLLGLLDVPDFAAWVGGALLGIPPGEAEDVMEQLVDAHFLTVSGTDATGTLRYRFHDLLRLYARDRAESDIPRNERDAALTRAFRGFLTLADEGHRREYGGDFAIVHGTTPRERDLLPDAVVDGLLHTPLDWYEAERASLVAVVAQACDLGQDELAWELVMCSVVLFETRSHHDDWRYVSERALEATQKAGNRRGEAAMCFELASVEMFQQRFDLAVPLFRSALRLFDRVQDTHGRALTLRNMAIVERVQGDLRSAMDLLKEARATFRSVGDLSAEAHALNQMAQIELEWQDPDTAVRLSLEAVRIAGRLGETRGGAQAYHRLAGAYVARQQYAEAEDAYGRVLRMVRRKGDTRGEAYALLGLGESRLAAGHPADAEGDLLDALQLAQRGVDLSLLARTNLALGRCFERLDRPTQAAQYLRVAVSMYHQFGSVSGEREAADELARMTFSRTTGLRC
ncbi:BTAD domain-containing putative transcriptional regulator [Streptomyces sp. NPDC002004]